ncbi:amino acid permease [Conexibacter sp. JD483]|uniref:amino acid permease n=1 Tax=unclassified Conexibacter TaxID=2627773 RepID=UPI0027285BA8|nr:MULTISPECIES: amino acid permease [unclassified Conexibacter]MDO8186076.1 amino acid permease [Conexibacter sp. CPCC 205706]MDO8199566.1 amino acid permease [Conexibacter sp. CPCC 205762]MDR9372422.1 amino acid permease [Conexibacter sp. JD483]
MSIAATAEHPPQDAQPELQRTLRQRHMTMIAFGGVIGAGLFVGSSTVIAATGPAAVLSYLIAGAIVLSVLRMLGELAVARPALGSFSAYARDGIGPWAGFTIGWLYWYQWTITLAIEATAGATLLQRWVDLPVAVMAGVLLCLLTATSLRSARSFGEFEFWFASIKVTAIVIFIAICLGWLVGAGDSPGLQHLTDGGGFAPAGVAPIFAGVVVVFFAFYGGEVVTIAAAESDDPGRSIARATMSMIVRMLVFYVVSILLIVLIVPWQTIRSGDSPFTDALSTIGLGWGAEVMAIVIVTAVLSALNSGIYAAPRMLYAQAGAGDAPRALTRLNRGGVPQRATLATSAVGLACIVIAYALPGEAFTLLVNSAGAVAVAVYLLIAVSELRLRRQIERETPEALTLKMWLFPWLTYLTIAAMVGIFAAFLFVPAVRSQLIPSAISIAVIVLASLVVTRRRARAAG